MPLQATSGAASYDAFGGGAAVVPTYIENVFSTYLRTSNGTTATVVNNLDLSGKGGLVWTKNRGSAQWHVLYDTVRGGAYSLTSNNTGVSRTNIAGAVTFNADGYSIVAGFAENNASGNTYVDWVLREQPKFFDIQTWTGSGANRTISHALDSVPGCIIVKRTDTTADWAVYHRSLANTEYLVLNSTAAAATGATWWNSTTPTSSVFSVGTDATVNASGGTYIAYIFAHDAGGFGLTGTDNVISCGSYTGNGSSTGPTVTLGYEPQWLLIKNTTSGAATSNWQLYDSMRGLSLSRSDYLLANKTDAENGVIPPDITPTATGFFPSSSNLWVNTNGSTYIYIAIRRGPMKVPTSGTSVFSPIVATNSQGTDNTTGFPLDMQIANIRSGYASNGVVPSRLTGVSSNTTSSGSYLRTPSTNAEATGSDITQYWGNTGFQTSSNWAGSGMVYWNFRRAPSFFDVVCYTGNGGVNNVQNHALASSIGMLIIKRRDSTGNWSVFALESGGNYSYWNSSGAGTGQGLNGTGAATGTNYSGYNSYLTSTTFNAAQIAGSNDINANGGTYVAYLFATCAGVSKVGSFTGNGSSQTINCGFTGGARFVLIKRTDSVGDWYVWDTARGIVSGNDSYLLLNSTDAEVTNTDYIDTYSAGFEISSTAPAAINASGGSFIFFAVA